MFTQDKEHCNLNHAGKLTRPYGKHTILHANNCLTGYLRYV